MALPGAVPEAGLRLSQAPLSPTVQLSVPPPVLVMLTVLAAGFVPPCVPVNDRLVGLRPIVGDAAATVSVTGTACGVFVAPVAVAVIVAL